MIQIRLLAQYLKKLIKNNWYKVIAFILALLLAILISDFIYSDCPSGMCNTTCMIKNIFMVL